MRLYPLVFVLVLIFASAPANASEPCESTSNDGPSLMDCLETVLLQATEAVNLSNALSRRVRELENQRRELRSELDETKTILRGFYSGSMIMLVRKPGTCPDFMDNAGYGIFYMTKPERDKLVGTNRWLDGGGGIRAYNSDFPGVHLGYCVPRGRMPR